MRALVERWRALFGPSSERWSPPSLLVSACLLFCDDDRLVGDVAGDAVGVEEVDRVEERGPKIFELIEAWR
jgi:hypothetical protein